MSHICLQRRVYWSVNVAEILFYFTIFIFRQKGVFIGQSIPRKQWKITIASLWFKLHRNNTSNFRPGSVWKKEDKVDKSNSTLWQYRKTYSNQFGFCRFISPMYSHSFSLLFYFLLPSVPLSLSPASSTKTVQLIPSAICLQSSLITHLTGFTY